MCCLCQNSRPCRCSSGQLGERCSAQNQTMTWSKESIGDGSSVEATPGSTGHGAKQLRKCDSIRRSRRIARSGKLRGRAGWSAESSRRKYSPRNMAPVHHSQDANEPRRASSPSAERCSVSPKRLAGSVRHRAHALRRSSRRRTAFKERGPRVLVRLPSPTPHDSESCARDSSLIEPAKKPQATSADALQQPALSDVGPQPVELTDLEEEETCCVQSESAAPLAAEQDEFGDDSRDLGQEPRVLLDSSCVDVTGGGDEMKRSESILKKILRKSTSLVRKPCKGRARLPQGAAKRRRRREPVRRMVRRPRKVVVMGDMFCGKSNLISAYCRDRFTRNYIPTLLSTCVTDAKVFGENIELVIVEVVGRDDYARLRKCAYHKMDAVILCYSAGNAEGIRRITDYWVPELQLHAPKVPFLLVATKKDVRDEVIDGRSESLTSEEVVPTSHGQQLARKIGAHAFIECSALYRDNTRNVFETAAQIALQKSRRKRKTRRNCQNDCIIS